MELRWLIRCNPVTAQQVRDKAAEMPCPMMEAKRLLENRTERVLQYRTDWLSDWQDVPTVVLPHETPKP